MPSGKRLRKFILASGLVFTALAVALGSLPLWLPWALRPIAGRFGMHYDAYERAGYSHYVLVGLGFTNRDVTLQAKRFEALVPTVWAWRCLRANQSSGQPCLRVSGWRFDLASATNQPIAARPAPPRSQFAQATSAFEALRRWLPEAALSDGAIRIGASELTLPAASWSQGELVAEVRMSNATNLPAWVLQYGGSNLIHAATGELRFRLGLDPLAPASPPRSRYYTLQIRSDPLELKCDFTCLTTALGLEIRNTNLFQGNRVEGWAQWAGNDVWPRAASLIARDFRFPAGMATVQDYDPISGSASAIWEDGRFGVDVTAGANPASGQTNLPPIDLSLHAQGDTNSVTITTAKGSAGWLTAELSRGLRLYYGGELLHEAAALKVSADLSHQPWFPAQGILAGEADFIPLGGKLPVIRFQVSGFDAGIPGFLAKTLRVDGNLDWPRLEIATTRAVLADGSTAEVEGKLDLGKKTVADGRFDLRGRFAQRWLPAGSSCDGLRVWGDFQGSLREISHRGHLEITNLIAAQLRPLRASGTWSGHTTSLNTVDLELTSGANSILARGALSAALGSVDLRLTNLSLLTNGQAVLELAAPWQFNLQYPSPAVWRVRASPFDWSGRAGQLHAELSADWPQQGEARFSVRQLSSTFFSEFFVPEYPAVEIKTLSGALGWTNGPAAFAVEAAISGRWPAKMLTGLASSRRLAQTQADSAVLVSRASSPSPRGQGQIPLGPSQDRSGKSNEPPSDLIYTISLKLSGDQDGLVLSNLLVMSQASRAATIRGFLPVRFSPGSTTNLMSLDRAAPLECTASVQPEGPFWNWIAEGLGVGLRQPALNLRLSGNWQEPHAQIDLSAQQIQLRAPGVTLPSLEDLRVSAELDPQKARIREGRLLLQGQPMSLTAEMPLDATFWSGLTSGSPPDWQKASARFQMNSIELAAFEPLYPKLLTPQGTMNVDLALRPGANLEGTIQMDHARTRPLGQLGPIRDINLKLLFQDRVVKLESAKASVSGAPVRLTGQANLKGSDWLRGAIPPFEISLRGDDVLLQRQPESIIRGDLDLTVSSTNGATPLISGTAHLRDSYYLSDLSALVSGKIASPERRPPYFSITDPALADWRLAVSVDGVRFMKIRSPLFNGEVSANLKLQGTLRDPVALGDGRVDSGYVRFPFATFQVQQGLVTLTSQDPYRPQVLMTAASKQYGYEVRMDLAGPADALTIQFNSTPPLSSEQILLMVTAGEMPQATFSLTAQQRAQTVALFFGRDLLAKLGLGDQSQERLAVRSGQEVSDQGRPTYNVEYKLAERWFLVGEYDRFGNYNAGVKWLIYSR